MIIDAGYKHSIFDIEIKNDPDIMLDVWVNYHESREVREQVAAKWWKTLYGEPGAEELPSSGTLLDELIRQTLERFIPFSRENRELTNKLIKEFFHELKGLDYYDSLDSHSMLIEQKSELERYLTRLVEERAGRITGLEKVIKRKERMDISRQTAYIMRNDYNKKMLALFEMALFNMDNVEQSDFYSFDDAFDRLNSLEELFSEQRRELEKLAESFGEAGMQSESLKRELVQCKESLGYIRRELEKIGLLKESWQRFFEEVKAGFDDYYERLRRVADIFGELSFAAGLGWDLSKGILKSKKWLQLEHFSKLLESLEEIKELAEVIGRLKEDDADNFDTLLKEEKVIKKNKNISSIAKSELFGTHLSNDLLRLLPVELSALTKPNLKKLFYAKYVENRLLTYQLKGRVDSEERRLREEKKSKLKKGPIIASVDTSGSMHGAPEKIAKAATLAMVKIALREKRECYLIAFSSTGQLKELELTKGKGALDNLLEFLMFTFGGGTDFETPLERSLELLNHKSFSQADILMVTDGEGGIRSQFRERLDRQRERQNFKIYSLIIGSDIEKNAFSDRVINIKASL